MHFPNPLTQTLRFVFLELGRFNKQISDLETPFEKWIYLLKHMHNMKGIPSEFDEALFKRLFLLAEIGNFTPGELEQYYKSLNNMGDYYNILHTAKEEAERIGLEKGLEKGLAQGLAEGRAEGRAEAQLEMARKMLEAGMAVDQIVQFTDLTLQEVQSLQ